MPRLRRLLADLEIADRVRLLGLVPRKDQMQIFRHATLVLQPPLFEGWSTVLEDAKALGRPVLASDIAVHREQFESAGDGTASFFPPTDHEALAAALAVRWRRVPPGPDPTSETDANARNRVRCTGGARAVLRTVDRAIAIGHSPGNAGIVDHSEARPAAPREPAGLRS